MAKWQGNGFWSRDRRFESSRPSQTAAREPCTDVHTAAMGTDAMSAEQPITSSRASRPLAVIVLAAGLGTRMKSEIPKVMHPVCGRPLLAYVLDAAAALDPARVVVVTGAGDDDPVAAVLPAGVRARRAGRAPGHAATPCGPAWCRWPTSTATSWSRSATRRWPAPSCSAGLRRHHVECTARATVTTVVLAEPAQYGRVVRDAAGDLTAIVEARDASPDELAITEINVGFYVFDAAGLRRFAADPHRRQRPGRVLPHRPGRSLSAGRRPRGRLSHRRRAGQHGGQLARRPGPGQRHHARPHTRSASCSTA